MLTECQETVAASVAYFGSAALVFFAYSALFTQPQEFWSGLNLIWIGGYATAVNLVWTPVMALYRRYLQPKVLKSC